MSWAIVAVLGGGLIGAGGSVAGGILSKPDAPKPVFPPTFDPASDPLTAANTADLLASQGFFLPSVFQQAGPVAQAIQAFRALPSTGADTRRRVQGPIAAAIDALEAGEAGSSDPRLSNIMRMIASNAGYGSIDELLASEQQYQQQVAQNRDRYRGIAELSGERRLAVEQGLSRLAQSPLDLGELRTAELARLNRQLDERQSGALRAASVGGYNPGRQLEGIERLRSDADLDALTRAVGLLSGQGQSIANLQALNPANRAQSLSPSVQQFRIPTLPGAAGFIQSQPDPFGASVSSAANQLGGTASSLGLLSYYQKLQNQNKPATDSIHGMVGGAGSGGFY